MRGVVVGLLADAVKLTANYLAFRAGLTQVIFWQLTSTYILPAEEIVQPLGILVGALVDITVSASLGVLFLYVLKYTGSEYLWLKGLGYGMLTWAGLFATLLGPHIEKKVPQDAAGILVTIVAHACFGLALAWFSKLYLERAD
ncbi:MAG: hypothetical protein GX195_06480 [Firmicutes bacterium]|jgi:hypothetical protein|nr:hypothetical protein [Bacillota bacterium]